MKIEPELVTLTLSVGKQHVDVEVGKDVLGICDPNKMQEMIEAKIKPALLVLGLCLDGSLGSGDQTAAAIDVLEAKAADIDDKIRRLQN